MLRNQSGRQDSNLRPSAPKAPALPSCATPRYLHIVVAEVHLDETSCCSGFPSCVRCGHIGATDSPLSLVCHSAVTSHQANQPKCIKPCCGGRDFRSAVGVRLAIVFVGLLNSTQRAALSGGCLWRCCRVDGGIRRRKDLLKTPVDVSTV